MSESMWSIPKSYLDQSSEIESIRAKLAASEAARLKAESACREIRKIAGEFCEHKCKVDFRGECSCGLTPRLLAYDANPGSNLLERLKAADTVCDAAEKFTKCNTISLYLAEALEAYESLKGGGE